MFQGLANLSYNPAKRLWYYGFKGSFEVSDQGLVVAYTITPAAIHDLKMVTTLLQQAHCAHVLADKGI